MKAKIKLKESLKKFQNEMKGYGIKVQLFREDTENSKRFEDLDFEIVFNHLTRVLPGTQLSVNSGFEEFFENSEDDDFN
ncbi:hypothetical protein JYT29_01380 [Nitrospina gracilis]|nr:hypothetical protein [Nitrospina gracilis]